MEGFNIIAIFSGIQLHFHENNIITLISTYSATTGRFMMWRIISLTGVSTPSLSSSRDWTAKWSSSGTSLLAYTKIIEKKLTYLSHSKNLIYKSSPISKTSQFFAYYSIPSIQYTVPQCSPYNYSTLVSTRQAVLFTLMQKHYACALPLPWYLSLPKTF